MRVTRRWIVAGSVGAALVVAGAVAVVATRGDDLDSPSSYRCDPTEQLGLAQEFVGGDIDGDGHVDVVRMWRLEFSGCTAAPVQDCGLDSYDSWMVDAELSTVGHRQIVLPVSQVQDARLGQIWGVADAAGDGHAEIFVGLDAATYDTTPETSASGGGAEETPSGFVLGSLYFGVVTLAGDELVLVTRAAEANDEECLRLGYTVLGGHHEAEGFACRDVAPGGGRELLTMLALPPHGDPSALEGDQAVYRWRGPAVELVETRPMTGTFDDFRRVDCEGVGSPPLSNIPADGPTGDPSDTDQ
jgi:hypothetical protein